VIPFEATPCALAHLLVGVMYAELGNLAVWLRAQCRSWSRSCD
jgi:hypothetical protein